MEPGPLHLKLAYFAQRRLRPALPDVPRDEDDLPLLALEAAFLADERAAVAAEAAKAPSDPKAFVAWFESLREDGPGQGDPLFSWLEEMATLSQMRWFLAQEVAGEAGFDDLVALTQVRMPTKAKLELARNYWDEMGRGREPAMHGPLLAQLAATLHVEAEPGQIVWEALALANLLVALALDRRYAYHSVGALGAIELTAPTRVGFVDRGLARLGIPKAARRYFTLHATLDVKHSEAWNREVVTSLVAEEPRAARAIAEGALMRLRAGARCFERYRRELWRLQPAQIPQGAAFPLDESRPDVVAIS
jgi:heme oxygenase-like protein